MSCCVRVAYCSNYLTYKVAIYFPESGRVNHAGVILLLFFFSASIERNVQADEVIDERVAPCLLPEKVMQAFALLLPMLFLANVFEDKVEVGLLKMNFSLPALLNYLPKQHSSVALEEFLLLQTQTQKSLIDVGILVFKERMEAFFMQHHQLHVGRRLQGEFPLFVEENFFVANVSPLLQHAEAEVVGKQQVVEGQAVFWVNLTVHFPLELGVDVALELVGFEWIFLHEEKLSFHDENYLLRVFVFPPNHLVLLEELGTQCRNHFR